MQLMQLSAALPTVGELPTVLQSLTPEPCCVSQSSQSTLQLGLNQARQPNGANHANEHRRR